MSCVKSSGNKSTETIFASILRKENLSGWRRHYPLIGKPDFVFPRKKIAVFVDGCFWHGCRAHCRMPKTNKKYWKQKIGRNVKHDREINRELVSINWRIIRFWEHDLNGGRGFLAKMKQLRKAWKDK